MRAKYFPKTHPWKPNKDTTPVMFGVTSCQQRNRRGKGFWQIGNDQQVSVWKDKWIPDAVDNMLRHDLKVQTFLVFFPLFPVIASRKIKLPKNVNYIARM